MNHKKDCKSQSFFIAFFTIQSVYPILILQSMGYVSLKLQKLPTVMKEKKVLISLSKNGKANN